VDPDHGRRRALDQRREFIRKGNQRTCHVDEFSSFSS
jgi:hypothetical protein